MGHVKKLLAIRKKKKILKEKELGSHFKFQRIG